jgi:hypothetical protein
LAVGSPGLPPGIILWLERAVCTPSNIPAAKLDKRQRALTWRQVETYARTFEPRLAEARGNSHRH